jgi:hypothetical protein
MSEFQARNRDRQKFSKLGLAEKKSLEVSPKRAGKIRFVLIRRAFETVKMKSYEGQETALYN